MLTIPLSFPFVSLVSFRTVENGGSRGVKRSRAQVPKGPVNICAIKVYYCYISLQCILMTIPLL